MTYYAFISYRRKDEKWAIWLQRKLERYRLPSVLCRQKKIPRKLNPVFRDKTDLSVGGLIDSLREKLKDSRYLIVICSPDAVSSQYISDEVDFFASVNGKEHIIPFIVRGIPYSLDSQECYPESVRRLFPRRQRTDENLEILGANINENGKGNRFMKKERAFVMVLSKMLGVSFDTLWKRHRRYLIRRMVMCTIMAGIALSLPFAVWARTRAFDISLSLCEDRVAGLDLPVPEGQLSLAFVNDTLTRDIMSLEDEIVFNNIPGTFRGKPAALYIHIFGFEPKDSTVCITDTLRISLKRDISCFGHIEGVVRNESDDGYVGGVRISIEGISTFSDCDGHFILEIPLERQRQRYNADLEYNGSVSSAEDIIPMQNNDLIINTIYVR